MHLLVGEPLRTSQHLCGARDRITEIGPDGVLDHFLVRRYNGWSIREKDMGCSLWDAESITEQQPTERGDGE